MLQVVDPILDIDDGLICLEVPVPRRVAIQVFLHGDDVLSRGPKLVRAFLEHPGAFVVQCLNLRVRVRHLLAHLLEGVLRSLVDDLHVVARVASPHLYLHEALRRLVNDIHLVVLDLPLDVIELHILKKKK